MWINQNLTGPEKKLEENNRPKVYAEIESVLRRMFDSGEKALRHLLEAKSVEDLADVLVRSTSLGVMLEAMPELRTRWEERVRDYWEPNGYKNFMEKLNGPMQLGFFAWLGWIGIKYGTKFLLRGKDLGLFNYIDSTISGFFHAYFMVGLGHFAFNRVPDIYDAFAVQPGIRDEMVNFHEGILGQRSFISASDLEKQDARVKEKKIEIRDELLNFVYFGIAMVGIGKIAQYWKAIGAVRRFKNLDQWYRKIGFTDPKYYRPNPTQIDAFAEVRLAEAKKSLSVLKARLKTPDLSHAEIEQIEKEMRAAKKEVNGVITANNGLKEAIKFERLAWQKIGDDYRYFLDELDLSPAELPRVGQRMLEIGRMFEEKHITADAFLRAQKAFAPIRKAVDSEIKVRAAAVELINLPSQITKFNSQAFQSGLPRSFEASPEANPHPFIMDFSARIRGQVFYEKAAARFAGESEPVETVYSTQRAAVREAYPGEFDFLDLSKNGVLDPGWEVKITEFANSVKLGEGRIGNIEMARLVRKPPKNKYNSQQIPARKFYLPLLETEQGSAK